MSQETSPVVLEVDAVRKERSDPSGASVEILKGVSLSVRHGGMTVVFGPSGGGKSTLIRLLNRLEDPTSGRIFLRGEDIAGLDPVQLRRRIGLMPQKPFMFPGTVLSNLQRSVVYRRQPLPGAESPEVVKALDICQLARDILQRDARSLSIGQQQRVSLARTLISQPEVVLLDEPTSALDRPTGDRLGQTLHDLCQQHGLTLLMVSHDLRMVRRIADVVYYLEDGRILESGSPAEVFIHPQTAAVKRFLDEPWDSVQEAAVE